MQKIKDFIKKRKILLGVIVVVLAVSGYFGIKAIKGNAAGVTKYVMANVTKGTLIKSVTGTGQVSASNQVDIKPSASSKVTAVLVKAGQEVKTGDSLIQLDTSDAESAVSSAQADLQNAQLQLQKLQQPNDQASILQAQNSLTQAKQEKDNAIAELKKSDEDGFSAVTKDFADITSAINELTSVQQNISSYYNSIKNYSTKSLEYKNNAVNAFVLANNSYNKAFSDYKSTSRLSSSEAIEILINETYDASGKISDALKNNAYFVQYYQDQMHNHGLQPASSASSQLSSMSMLNSKINLAISDLLSAKQKIQQSKNSVSNSDSNIAERQANLDKINAGTDQIELLSQQNNVNQRATALKNAQKKLDDCNVTAPFDGIVATVTAKVGDSVSPSTSFITLITKDKIATVTLNEVDATKVKADQKVTITFDAITDLTLTGKVAQIDSIGTVSQGVVSYTAKIVFDSQDDRIKPGMSMSAAIITDSKADVLLVSSSAIKNSSYVEMPDEDVNENSATSNTGVILKKAVIQQQVEIGLANDTQTEITSGLKEGDLIIVRTIAPTTTKTTTSSSSSNSLFQMGGSQKNMGGNNFRSSGTSTPMPRGD